MDMAIEYACIMPHPPLIVPAVGRGQEQAVKATSAALEKVARRIAALKPDTIILSTPHSVMYGDYIHISPGKTAAGDLGRFGAHDVRMQKNYDPELVAKISDTAFEDGIRAGTLGEKDKQLDHATLVPLYFVDQHYTGYNLVRVSLSGLPYADHYQFGQCVAKASKALGRRAVFIASGDLSHKLSASGPYGYAPEGPQFDAQCTAIMKSGDFAQFLEFDESFCDAAAECGLRSFIELAGVLDGRAVTPYFYSYEGPFGVGYAVCGFETGGADENRRFLERYEQAHKEKLAQLKNDEDAYVRLARLSLETYVKTGKHAKLPEGLPDEMRKTRAGVFVSLKKHGRLRGCIGTISPVEPSVAQEILRNAVSAGTGDPRFDVIEAQELPELVYSVDILGTPEPISSLDELDTKRYGVIVTSGFRRGLLLPNLEGIDTPQKQVKIALQKAHIGEEESYKMERFEVVRHAAQEG